MRSLAAETLPEGGPDNLVSCIIRTHLAQLDCLSQQGAPGIVVTSFHGSVKTPGLGFQCPVLAWALVRRLGIAAWQCWRGSPLQETQPRSFPCSVCVMFRLLSVPGTNGTSFLCASVSSLPCREEGKDAGLASLQSLPHALQILCYSSFG